MFPSDKQVEAMLDRIRQSFKYTLKTITWMDDVTKRSALEKVDAIPQMIGE